MLTNEKLDFIESLFYIDDDLGAYSIVMSTLCDSGECFLWTFTKILNDELFIGKGGWNRLSDGIQRRFRLTGVSYNPYK